MCGLVGFWDFNNRYTKSELSIIITKMTEQLIKRGPDSQGIWVDENLGIALGHQRLSIRDISEIGRAHV